MILITGANGKTGRAVQRALVKRSLPVRAMVHHPDQVDAALGAGAREVVVGDLLDAGSLERAMAGVGAVYLICPNMHPDEAMIGERAIETARRNGVNHVVYHSVLYPQIEEMPHHWNKLRVEEFLFTAGVPFTILQPCAYMQNILGYWDAISKNGIYAVPYPPATRISIVDLEDVAVVAGRVLTEAGHAGAIYELVGPEPLSQEDLAQTLTRILDRPVQAVGLDRAAWAAQARQGGVSPYAVETLEKMFLYYERYGFAGSPRVLEWLLARPPATFADFVQRTVNKKQSGE